MIPVCLYIHIPFCIHRCSYCDFNTYAGLDSLIPIYTDSICQEIDFVSSNTDQKILLHTIYFGGGTPSLLSINQIEKILSIIHKSFKITPHPEISLEANPGTVSKKYLKDLHSLGINRLSIGMQSANASELKLLDRQHTLLDVYNAVDWSRSIGISNINLDLIYAIPHQKVKTWLHSLETALTYEPTHLSLYSLSIEEDTPIFSKVKYGTLPQVNQDLAAEMYELGSELVENHGYYQYEISNWASRDNNGELLSCKHNLQYWRSLPYLGVGAGSHGFINEIRTINICFPGEYINNLSLNRGEFLRHHYDFPCTPATQEIIPIDNETEIGEVMMMGLRLTDAGVSNNEFKDRFGLSLQQRFSTQIDGLIKVGLLEWTDSFDKRLRLTKKGRLLGNLVFMEFL